MQPQDTPKANTSEETTTPKANTTEATTTPGAAKTNEGETTPVVTPHTAKPEIEEATVPKKTDAIEGQDELRKQMDVKTRECSSAIKEKIQTSVEAHLSSIKKMYHEKKDQTLKENKDALEKKLEQKFGIKPEDKKQQLEENELFAKYDEEILKAFHIAEKISDRQLDN